MRKLLDGSIVIAAIGFIAILALSAIYDHTIIWLHVFQAFMYLAVIGLLLRENRGGYFLGAAIAGFWNYTNLFVTNFFVSGLRALEDFASSGHLAKPDQLIAVVAVAFNFVILIACLVRIVQTSRKAGPDVLRFIAVSIVANGYFAVCVALFQPRYLTIFPRMLHPHGLY